MNFVSYAQNFEDVMLRRALAKVERGFYIDVGAAEPTADSVTAAFYERGWRGINIEPMAGPFGRLTEARPEDINLNVAVENRETAARYFAVDGGNGISTGVRRLAETYKDANWDVSQVTVTVIPLRDICEKYVGDRQIHFLKVDVEGNEREVLASADFSKFRPWIIVVEATEPNSTVPSHEEWEGLLLDAAYKFVYFDGLNRFYLSEEKNDELAPAFAVPPNWFDGFVRAPEAKATRRVTELEREVEELRRGWLMEKAGREQAEKVLANNGWLTAYKKETPTIDEKSKPYPAVESGLVHQEIEELRTKLDACEKHASTLERERDACYQELFESSRYAAWLSQEKVRLQLRIEELEQVTLVEARSAVAAMLSSTSWRVTKPLRSIKLAIRRQS
ncbi:FkbM family methyltransferase [Paraburkholderia rhizosphaerae]|uniref:FkbM family methyltransferase n=1 Tax=Paraburkholderia rhizosphaerae TaxID=480658 RepID=A0A4R8L573_9BURK|nr:FkbM family methyltransferase [Paraburkholderia rhizosphaerae]TDY37148.1 FkbM family methyltransferase [Paraburkholderia rhizosphaerae]